MVFTREHGIVIASAVLAATPFLFAFYCAELLFIYLVPLMWFSQKNNYFFTFGQGCIWGLIFFTLFFSDIYLYILYYGNGAFRFYVILFLIFYNTFLCGCWFYASKIFSMLYVTGVSYLLGWIVSAYFFWLYINYFYFSPLGIYNGITFAHSIIPLSARSVWLFFLKYSGKEIFLLLTLVINGFVAYGIINARYYYLLYIIGMAVPFFAASYSYKKEFIEDWFKDFGCLSLGRIDHDPTLRAEKIMQGLAIFEECYDDIKYIIMPESTFPFPLNVFKKYCSLWHTSSQKKIFIGSHRSQDEKLFNTFYHIEGGAIIDSYDKKNPMFFTEYIPKVYYDLHSLCQLFLKDKIPFSSGHRDVSFDIPDAGAMEPLICSDLFFRSSVLPPHRSYICIANDSLLYHKYPADLMLLYAKSTAALRDSYILYCAYNHAEIITPFGDTHSMTRVCLN